MAELITDNFKGMVSEYIEICDELSEFNKKIKNVKDRKKELEEDIKNFMIDAELFNLDLQKAGTLSIQTKKVIKKASKMEISDILLETIASEDHRDSIIDKIFPQDSVTEVTKLQRKKGRASA